MYPRNAASPPPLAIGQVVQISDGAVQTTGASVRVSTGTGAYGAGSGTLACDTTSGIWSYTPTQAETNDTVIRIAVYKASCLGCAVTVVTSASATAGKVVLSAETHTSAVIPTVTTLTNAPSDSSGTTTLLSRLSSARAGYLDNINNANLLSVPAFPSNFAALAITVGGAVTAGTVSDKTGYSINGTTTTLDALQTALNSAHGAGSWATATGFSTHSAADVWAVGTRTITGGTITTYTGNTPQTGDAYAAIASLSIPTVAAIADGVWDEAMSGHTTDGTYGGRIVRATNSNVTVQITGSNHIAADVHEFQAGVIAAADFADNAITSSVVAASAVSEIVVGVLTTAMTEAYRSTGAAPTVAQALFEILQNLTEFSISGTTKTAKKLDGSTTAKTYRLDSATTPTSITEAT